MQIQVTQGEAHAQPIVVLRDAPVPCPVKAEDTLKHVERVLDPGPHPRLSRVPALRGFIHIVPEPGPAAGHILRMRRGYADQPGLALISPVSPYLSFFPVQ